MKKVRPLKWKWWEEKRRERDIAFLEAHGLSEAADEVRRKVTPSYWGDSVRAPFEGMMQKLGGGEAGGKDRVMALIKESGYPDWAVEFAYHLHEVYARSKLAAEDIRMLCEVVVKSGDPV